jgi:hypothetical protein
VKSRDIARSTGRQRKFFEQRERAFAHDLEQNPAAIASAVRGLLEGQFGENEAAKAYARRENTEGLIVRIGELRYSLYSEYANFADEVLSRLPSAARARVVGVVAAVVARTPPLRPAPQHSRGNVRTVDLSEAVQVKLRGSSEKPKRSYTTPRGMFELRPGVYGKKL